ncbi:MAG: type II toxin-antitoxin system HicB family antitoxin [Nitrospinae bacterium]|nr:type II toxin-antitoxin system HicB family antitoxin [Nitrospinota bacterium]
MTFSIVYERVDDPSLPSGYYYAHIPALDLTTHGPGLDGAKAAALDLLKLWIEEKREHGETAPVELEAVFSKIEIDDAIFSA